MTRIGIVTEQPGETRVAATPQTAAKLRALGYDIVVESGAGHESSFPDASYEASGAAIVDRATAWGSDIVLKVAAPTDAEIALLQPGATLVGVLAPALSPDLLAALAARGVTALAMDAVPRISRAQSMDVLSSMANIAGYRAVVEAANEFGRFFTGQVTAAGKVPPAKVLVAGAGVAGLAGKGAGAGHLLDHVAFMRGIALDRLDKVRNQIAAPLELHVDAAPGLVDPLSGDDQPVIDGDHGAHGHKDQKNNDDKGPEHASLRSDKMRGEPSGNRRPR